MSPEASIQAISPDDTPSPTRTVPTRFLLLGAIFLLALGLRCAYYVEIKDEPILELPTHPIGSQTDQAFYWEWSSKILAGDWLGRDTPHPQYGWMDQMGDHETWLRWWGGKEIYQSEPFYSYAIAVARWLGLDLPAIIFAQLVIGAFSPLLIYAASRRIVGTNAALCAAAMMAIYGTLIFYTGTLLRDWTVTVVDPLLLWALSWSAAAASQRSPRWLASGAIAGASLWVKSTIQVFMPLVLLWMLFRDGPRQAHRQFPAILMLLTGLFIGLSPLISRNLAVGAPPLAVSNRPIEGFAVANPASNHWPIGFSHDPVASAEILEKANGSTMRAISETLKTYDGDWWLLVEHLWLKFRGLLDPFEVPNNLSPAFGRETSFILRVLPTWGILVPLAIAGLVMAGLPHARKHALLLLYGLASLIAVMTLLIVARYRMTLLPFLTIYAGVGINYLIVSFSEKQWIRAIAWCVPVILTAISQTILFPIPQLRQNIFDAAHPLSYNASITIAMERHDPFKAMDFVNRWRAHTDRLPPRQADELRDLTYSAEANIYYTVIDWQVKQNRMDLAQELTDEYHQARSSMINPDRLAPSALAYARAGQWNKAITDALNYLASDSNQHWRELCKEILADASRRGYYQPSNPGTGQNSKPHTSASE